MPFVVLGINHRSAPVELREQMVFSGTDLTDALGELGKLPGVRESVIVSTCNRTELYCHTDTAEVRLGAWLEQWHELVDARLHESIYQIENARAVAHVFSVASGLDSMILGEPQILGQIKDAYRVAQECGTTGPYLNRLMQATFSVAKRVRTQTRIGENAVSVASAAVSLARTVFSELENQTALLVGAGETIELAARHLRANGLKRMIIANRSLDRARDLAQEFDGYAITLDQLPSHLPEADIVISSTASPTPVISFEATRAAVRARKRRPIFMVDIAVPRDIEAEVATLEDVYLFTIDDLQNVVSENLESRREAARDADRLIAAEVDRFEHQLKTLDAVPAIRQLRSDAESVKAQTLEQARRLLATGRDPQEVIEFLAATLTNRLLHNPSQRLREAAEHGEADLIRTALELFATRPDASRSDTSKTGKEPAADAPPPK